MSFSPPKDNFPKLEKDRGAPRDEEYEIKVTREETKISKDVTAQEITTGESKIQGETRPTKVDVGDLLEGTFLISEKIRAELIKLKESNKELVKISRKEAGKYGIPELKFSVVFDDAGVPYALYRGKAKLLGKGGQGRVKIVQNLITGKWMAVKIMSIVSSSKKTSFLQESEMLAAYGRLRGKAFRPDKMKGYLFQDIITGEKLFNTIMHTDEKDLSDPNYLKSWLEIAHSTLKELKDLHDTNILHRDIKPENTIYIPGVGAFLIDFGLAHKLKGKFLFTTQGSGTQGYMAPELLKKGEEPLAYSKKSDIYAMGITLKGSLEKIESALKKTKSSFQGKGEMLEILYQLKSLVVLPMIQEKLKDRPSASNSLQNITQLQQAFSKIPIPKLSEIKISEEAAFLKFINEGDLETVKNMLDKNPSLSNCVNNNDFPVLYQAVIKGNLALLKILLQTKPKPNVNAMDKVGLTALHAAAEFGYLDMAQMLIEAKANVNARTTDGTSPLFLAARFNHAPIVQLLIEQGAIVDAAISDGGTPLYVAVQNNSLEAAKILLANGANPNTTLKSGYSVLKRAISSDFLDMATLLIDRGARPSTEEWIELLGRAASLGKSEILDKVLKMPGIAKLINQRLQSGWSALELAVDRGHLECIAILLKAGAEINTVDVDGNSPLHVAAKRNNLKVVQELIAKGASSDIRNKWSQGPFELAIDADNLEVAQFLFYRIKAPTIDQQVWLFNLAADKGDIPLLEKMLTANPSLITSKSKQGLDALDWAIFRGQEATVDFLIERGADVNVVYPNDINTLFVAAQANQMNIARKLLSNVKPDKINERAIMGDTPLFTAIVQGNRDIVQLFLENKADVNIPLKDGTTPFRKALSTGNLEIAQLLFKTKALLMTTDDWLDYLKLAIDKGNLQLLREILAEKPALVNGFSPKFGSPLFAAVLIGNLDLVKELLSLKADINARNVAGFTALHMAAEQGFDEIAVYLLENGADINAESNEGSTPLHLAVKYDQDSMLKLLLTRKYNVDLISRGSSISPFLYAIKNRQTEFVKIFLEFADPLVIKSEIERLQYSIPVYDLLHYPTLKLLLENGLVPWESLLYNAVVDKDYFLVKLLLQHGADPSNALTHRTTNEIQDLLMQSKIPFKIEAAKQNKIKMHQEDWRKLLFECIREFNINGAQELLQLFPDLINEKDYEGNSVLHELMLTILEKVVRGEMSALTEEQSIAMFQLLMKNKADAKAQNSEGDTALHLLAGSVVSTRFLASFKDSILQSLLEHADINAQNATRNTPLHIAYIKNNSEFANFLLKNKANLSIENNAYRKPLWYLLSKSPITIIDDLKNAIQAGFNPNDLITRRETAMDLILANQESLFKPKLVKFMLDNGLEINPEYHNMIRELNEQYLSYLRQSSDSRYRYPSLAEADIEPESEAWIEIMRHINKEAPRPSA